MFKFMIRLYFIIMSMIIPPSPRMETQPLQLITPKAWVTPVTTPALVGDRRYPGCPAIIVTLIRQDFGSVYNWAIGVAWRESRCQPGRRNPSTASGIFQMKVPLHSSNFAAVGCSWTQWADPTCNIAAAADLYHKVGASPWG